MEKYCNKIGEINKFLFQYCQKYFGHIQNIFFAIWLVFIKCRSHQVTLSFRLNKTYQANPNLWSFCPFNFCLKYQTHKIDLAQFRINLPLLKEQIDDWVIALFALTGDNLEELLLHLRELYDIYVKTEQPQGRRHQRYYELFWMEKKWWFD